MIPSLGTLITTVMIAFYELKSNFILYNYLIGSVMLAQMRTMRHVK